MQAVVTVLERGMRRGSRRGRWIAAALGSTAIGGAVWAASGEKPCTGGRDRVAPAWSPIKRVQVMGAFEAVGAPWADEIGRRVGEELDAYAQRWVDAHTDACHASRTSDGSNLDRTMACLVRRLDALEATTDLLVQGERRTLEHAPELTTALPAIEACADADQLGRSGHDLEAADPRFDRQRARLSKARALVVSGDFAEAERIAAAVVETAHSEGSETLEIEALLVQSSALIDKGDLEAASRGYEAAFFMAERIDAGALALEAAGDNALVVGWYLRQPQHGLEWLRHANAAARRIEPTPHEWFVLENRTGLVLDAAAKYAEALEHHQQALHWLEITKNQVDVARTRMNLGMTLMALGRDREGIEELRTAADLHLGAFGDTHPETQAARVNLAAHLAGVGQLDEALDLFEAVDDAVAGSDDVWPTLRLSLLVNWGVAAARARRFDEGIARLEEATQLAARMYGPTHGETFEARMNLAAALEGEGDLERAAAILRALRVDLDAAAERSPELGYLVDLNEAMVLRKLGRHDEALVSAHASRASAKRIDPDGVEMRDAWIEVATILEAMGRTAEAEALRASLPSSTTSARHGSDQ
jgi:tetratricopeptide (TPR) repeat protein